MKGLKRSFTFSHIASVTWKTVLMTQWSCASFGQLLQQQRALRKGGCKGKRFGRKCSDGGDGSEGCCCLGGGEAAVCV